MNPYADIYSMVDSYLNALEKQKESIYYWEFLDYQESELFYKGMVLTKYASMLRKSSMRCLTCDEVKSLEIHCSTQELMQPVNCVDPTWLFNPRVIHTEKE